MIHHINKITGADFQTVTGFRHEKNICEQKIQNFKIYIFSDSFLALYLTVLTYFAQILLFKSDIPAKWRRHNALIHEPSKITRFHKCR